jgi:hypothetical protein
MNKFMTVVLVISLFLFTGYAQAETLWFSPLTAIPVGPNGPATNVLKVEPYCCPSTAIEITASEVVDEFHSPQWVLLGLTTQLNKVIKGVEIYYEVDTARLGSTYISQVRLTQMTTPDYADVIHDDPTELTSKTPTSYISLTQNPKPKVKGTITLELRVIFGNTADSIRVGGIKLIY